MFFFVTAYTFLTDITFIEKHAAHLTLALLLSMFVGLVVSLCVLLCRRKVDSKYSTSKKHFLIDKSVTLQCQSDLNEFRESRILSRISSIHSPPSSMPTNSLYSIRDVEKNGIEMSIKKPATLSFLKGYCEDDNPYLNEILRYERIQRESKENDLASSPSPIEPFRLCYLGENSPSGTMASIDILQYDELSYDDSHYSIQLFDTSTPTKRSDKNSSTEDKIDEGRSRRVAVDDDFDDLMLNDDIEDKKKLRGKITNHDYRIAVPSISQHGYLSYGDILPSSSSMLHSPHNTSDKGYRTTSTSERGCNCSEEHELPGEGIIEGLRRGRHSLPSRRPKRRKSSTRQESFRSQRNSLRVSSRTPDPGCKLKNADVSPDSPLSVVSATQSTLRSQISTDDPSAHPSPSLLPKLSELTKVKRYVEESGYQSRDSRRASLSSSVLSTEPGDSQMFLPIVKNNNIRMPSFHSKLRQHNQAEHSSNLLPVGADRIKSVNMRQYDASVDSDDD